MRTDTEIKNELLDALASVLDERLREVGFTRNKRSLIYTRKLDESEQQITFNLHCHPHYQPGAEAHICPTVQLLIPQITETALALVRGNKILLAGSPQTIVGQPIDFLAPKDKHERWFASTEEQFAACCEKIRAFLVQWVLPFFSEVSAPFDLIRLHEVDDERLVKADRWHIYVASAYKLLGQPDKAREVVLSRFGKPGLRKRYEALFQSLGIE